MKDGFFNFKSVKKQKRILNKHMLYTVSFNLCFPPSETHFHKKHDFISAGMFMCISATVFILFYILMQTCMQTKVIYKKRNRNSVVHIY